MSADEKDPKPEKRLNENEKRILEEWGAIVSEAQSLDKSQQATREGSYQWYGLEPQKGPIQKRAWKVQQDAKARKLNLPTDSLPFWVLPFVPAAVPLEERKRTDKRRRKRSAFFLAALSYLRRNPNATAREVCIWCDAKNIRGPESWYRDSDGERSLQMLYRTTAKNKIDRYLSGVRRYRDEHPL